MQQSGTATRAPGAAEVIRDVAYGPAPDHRLDVYRPERAENAPVLFLVHGGAWMKGDKANEEFIANKVSHWVPKGYVVVSTNYRLSPPDPLQQADDVGMALAYVQEHAAEWGGDPNRVAVIGHSSGAHLVSMLASDPSIATGHGARPWLGTVALDSAAFDVEQIMSRQHFAFYDRVFREDPAYWRSASPIHRLSGAPKPMLCVCSSDRRDSCVQAKNFADKVADLGGRAEVVPIALSHRELNERLGTTGKYTETVDSFLQSLGLP